MQVAGNNNRVRACYMEVMKARKARGTEPGNARQEQNQNAVQVKARGVKNQKAKVYVKKCKAVKARRVCR